MKKLLGVALLGRIYLFIYWLVYCTCRLWPIYKFMYFVSFVQIELHFAVLILEIAILCFYERCNKFLIFSCPKALKSNFLIIFYFYYFKLHHCVFWPLLCSILFLRVLHWIALYNVQYTIIEYLEFNTSLFIFLLCTWIFLCKLF